MLVEFPDHPGVRVGGPAAGMPAGATSRSAWRSTSASSRARAASPSRASWPPPAAARDGDPNGFEQRAVISGVGQSAIGRQVDRSGLPAHARRRAGRRRRRRAAPGRHRRAGHVPRRRQGQPARLRQRRTSTRSRTPSRITTTWRQGQVEGMSLPFYGPAMAVATGQARHVVIWRTVKEGSAARQAGGRPAYGSVHPDGRGSPGLAAARRRALARSARWRRSPPATCTSTASRGSSWRGSR